MGILGLACAASFAVYELTCDGRIVVFQRDIYVYLVFFAAGMMYAQMRDAAHRIHRELLAAVSLVGLVALMTLYNKVYVNVWYERAIETLLILAACLPLYTLMLRSVHGVRLPAVLVGAIGWVSKASFFVFLFHRSLLTLMARLWPPGSFAQLLYIVLVGIPPVFILSAAGQAAYGRMVAAARRSR